MALWFDFLAAVQFLTRVPVSSRPYSEDALPRAVKFFPLAGALIGAAGSGVFLALDAHLPRLATAGVTVCFLALLTGCLHEDGLADAADGFGGGWTREQTLAIFRDSRIGSYGAAALALSLLLRCSMLAALPVGHVLAVLVSAHVLSRWSTLPLTFYLPPARAAQADDARGIGQGARVAKLTSAGTLVGGTLFAFAAAVLLLRGRGVAALVASVLVVLLSGWYYNRRIGGVTGDCFGATNQLTEIAVYACAVWAR